MKVIWLDYDHGDDANDGLSPETAKRTRMGLAKAMFELAEAPQKVDFIFRLPETEEAEAESVG